MQNWKLLENRGFLVHAFGGILYTNGLIAVLPLGAVLQSLIELPRIGRLENGYFVIYNRFWLNNEEFLIYWFLAPAFILISLWAIHKMERGLKMMDEAEKLQRKDKI